MYIKPNSPQAALLAYRVNDVVNDNPEAYISPQIADGIPDVFVLTGEELVEYINRGGEMKYIPGALWLDLFELAGKGYE